MPKKIKAPKKKRVSKAQIEFIKAAEKYFGNHRHMMIYVDMEREECMGVRNKLSGQEYLASVVAATQEAGIPPEILAMAAIACSDK